MSQSMSVCVLSFADGNVNMHRAKSTSVHEPIHSVK